MKSIILFLFLFSFNNSFSQKIEGTYKYEALSKKGEFEIEIQNDSVYLIKSDTSNKLERGKVRKRNGRFYILIQYDTVAKRNFEYIVKITRTKMIFYGNKQIKVGKITKNPTKAFNLKKTSS